MDTVIHKYFGSGTYCSVMTTLAVSNKEMEGIMKMARSLEDSGLLIQSKVKKRTKRGLLSMLLGKLGERLRGIVLVGKRVIRAGDRMIRLRHVF